MYVNIPEEMINMFGNEFEDYIADKLEALGFRCFKSVYIRYLDIESQIDIVAISRYCILCIECKSWDAIYISWDVEDIDWIYTDIDGDTKKVRNPVRQSKHHALNLHMSLMTNLEKSLYDRTGKYSFPCYPIVIIKGNVDRSRGRLASTRSSAIYFCNDLEDIKDRYFLKNNVENDANIIDEHIRYIEDKQNRSKRRLYEHAMYIDKCKRDKTGLWRKPKHNLTDII